MKDNMRENMIAPCGLNCAICKRALDKESPCPGCLGESESKPDFCANRCLIKKCAIRANLVDRFCDTCERYPCADVMEKETRYAIAYPLTESPIGNLAYLRQNGMDVLLDREKARWTCPACGGTVAVHTGVCSGCGREYSHLRL